jgi:hypothetical protein
MLCSSEKPYIRSAAIKWNIGAALKENAAVKFGWR